MYKLNTLIYTNFFPNTSINVYYYRIYLIKYYILTTYTIKIHHCLFIVLNLISKMRALMLQKYVINITKHLNWWNLELLNVI